MIFSGFSNGSLLPSCSYFFMNHKSPEIPEQTAKGGQSTSKKRSGYCGVNPSRCEPRAFASTANWQSFLGNTAACLRGVIQVRSKSMYKYGITENPVLLRDFNQDVIIKYFAKKNDMSFRPQHFITKVRKLDYFVGLNICLINTISMQIKTFSFVYCIRWLYWTASILRDSLLQTHVKRLPTLPIKSTNLNKLNFLLFVSDSFLCQKCYSNCHYLGQKPLSFLYLSLSQSNLAQQIRRQFLVTKEECRQRFWRGLIQYGAISAWKHWLQSSPCIDRWYSAVHYCRSMTYLHEQITLLQ